MKDIFEILASNGVFGVGLLNGGSQILPRPTLVAMATKFGTKLAITRLVCKISQRSLRISGSFWGRAVAWCQSNSTTTDPLLYCITIYVSV